MGNALQSTKPAAGASKMLIVSSYVRAPLACKKNLFDCPGRCVTVYSSCWAIK